MNTSFSAHWQHRLVRLINLWGDIINTTTAPTPSHWNEIYSQTLCISDEGKTHRMYCVLKIIALKNEKKSRLGSCFLGSIFPQFPFGALCAQCFPFTEYCKGLIIWKNYEYLQRNVNGTKSRFTAVILVDKTTAWNRLLLWMQMVLLSFTLKWK